MVWWLWWFHTALWCVCLVKAGSSACLVSKCAYHGMHTLYILWYTTLLSWHPLCAKIRLWIVTYLSQPSSDYKLAEVRPKWSTRHDFVLHSHGNCHIWLGLPFYVNSLSWGESARNTRCHEQNRWSMEINMSDKTRPFTLLKRKWDPSSFFFSFSCQLSPEVVREWGVVGMWWAL